MPLVVVVVVVGHEEDEKKGLGLCAMLLVMARDGRLLGWSVQGNPAQCAGCV